MNIKELAKKYGLVEGDFWNHKQSGQWILTHDAVEKVATKEGIRLVNIETLNSETELVRFLVAMSKGDVIITEVGEADDKNCFSSYKGCMAHKRGVDRCVLKLINAYEYGISSEVEAEDFKRPAHYQKTDNQVGKFSDMLEHPYFDGKKKETKKAWDDADTLTKAELVLSQMNQRIEQHNQKQESE